MMLLRHIFLIGKKRKIREERKIYWEKFYEEEVCKKDFSVKFN